MSRAIDEPYFKYTVYSAMESGMQVKCPKCQGLGIIVQMIITPILSVQVAVIKKAMIAQFIAMMFITIAKTVADIIE